MPPPSAPQGASGKHRLRCAPPVPLLPITPSPLQGALLGSAPRKVGHRARVAGSCVVFHSLRAAPWLRFPPPAHPAPSPSSPSAANPARLPCAAGGASAPAAPRGAHGKPQPGQAEYESSAPAGSCCQGHALRVARRLASLDSAHRRAELDAAAWPKKRAGGETQGGDRQNHPPTSLREAFSRGQPHGAQASVVLPLVATPSHPHAEQTAAAWPAGGTPQTRWRGSAPARSVSALAGGARQRHGLTRTAAAEWGRRATGWRVCRDSPVRRHLVPSVLASASEHVAHGERHAQLRPTAARSASVSGTGVLPRR